MKTCENCGKEHDGSYASGRFCSKKCSKGFSTKEKRSLINEKVSKKLSGNKKSKKSKKTVIHKRICTVCNNLFETKNEYRTVCSHSCISKLGGSAKKKDTSKMGGPRDGGGKSKVHEYINIHNESMKLNKDEIRVATVLDKLKLNWTRNWTGFKYITLDGQLKKYYPDFYLPDYNVYIEYKGWVTKAIINKMEDAVLKNNFKLLVVYSDDKRYRDLGLNIGELEQDPELLNIRL